MGGFVWVPDVPDSIDAKPLATTASHLFREFPYDRVSENTIVAWFTRPEVVFGVLVFYLFSKKPLKALAKAVDFDGQSKEFRAFIAVHNLALAVFSAVVVFNSWQVVLGFLWDHGAEATLCDQTGSLWTLGHGPWSTLFYLSKYWEFLDTWILVLKGKNASFLQVYHHTGIVIAMWIGVLSQSPWLILVVLLNSAIHTLMYTYFFVKTLYPSMHIPAAKNLTRAQIGQFLTGIALSFPVLFKGSQCDSQSSRIGLAWLHLYGYGLVGLFVSFAAQKYKKKKPSPL